MNKYRKREKREERYCKLVESNKEGYRYNTSGAR